MRRSGRSLAWEAVPLRQDAEPSIAVGGDPDSVGHQIAMRKLLRPVMSLEQQRLCGLKMDGKPRLVRGVAGSGKTVVLAHWLQKTLRSLRGKPDLKIWAVFANYALQRLIADTIEEAWLSDEEGGPLPWQKIELLHIKNLLHRLLPEASLRSDDFGFDYDAASKAFLDKRPVDRISPRCHAMFIDEGQDLGPNTLKLLAALVERGEDGDPRSRAVNIFYDNAQNIYGRATPKWSEMGLDMRGRSTVMKESFRSTRPITEFALNALYRLQPPDADPDHRELVERGLIEQVSLDGESWWSVRFNQVDGPMPTFRKFTDARKEFEAIGDQLVNWIRDEGVRPGDITVIYNGKQAADQIDWQIRPKLRAIGTSIDVQVGKELNRDDRTIVATTSHSFKGHDSEVLVITGVEQFTAKATGVLANNLYVAMTRARSILAVFGCDEGGPEGKKILAAVQSCLDRLLDRPVVDREISVRDDFDGVLGRIGPDHHDWLEAIWKATRPELEPLITPDGEILGEPIFWFKHGDETLACFEEGGPGSSTRHKLEDAGIEVITPGQSW